MTTGVTERRGLSYVAVLVCVGLATPALSDDQELSQVIVTASRIAEPLADSFWSTTVLTRSDIEARQVQSLPDLLADLAGINIDNTGGLGQASAVLDRKSTRLNSSHSQISYAVFCLKKKINVGT